MIKIKRISVWCPRYIANTILELDAAELKRNGITHLVFDLDNTLVKNRSNFIEADYINFIKRLRSAGFILMLGTNRRSNINEIAKSIEARVVQPRGISMKPFKSFYKLVQLRSGTSTAHIAMIGDHVINDIVGANRAGLITIAISSTNRRSILNHFYVRYVRKHCVS